MGAKHIDSLFLSKSLVKSLIFPFLQALCNNPLMTKTNSNLTSRKV